MSMSRLMEKKDIYVPEWVGKRIIEDAESFEFYKKDGALNINSFLRHLIVGYYNDYVKTIRDKRNKIFDILINNKIPDISANELSDSIIKEFVLPPVPARKGKNPRKLSLKPSKDMATLMMTINKNIESTDSLSQYFCRMFISYCNLQFSERERIVFKELFENIEQHCNLPIHKEVIVSIRTIWDPDKVHEVIPYKIETGKEEHYNYLLCAEIINNVQEARAYRINRLAEIEELSSGKIEDSVRDNLERMLVYGANYRIRNDDKKAIVHLTNNGVLNYKRIYTGRPKYYDIKENGDGYDYYFDVSNEQLFLYFRRFGKEAEIIAPDSLRSKMKHYYADAYSIYND